MVDRLPDAEFLRNLAKDMGLDLADQDELDRLNEIADGLEWRPIAEAPKKWPVFFYFPESQGRSGMMAPRFDVLWNLPENYFRQPSHWRPLPAPPVGTGEV